MNTRASGNEGVSLINLSKSYNGTKVVQELTLDVKKGEFVSLLGPSGCGKTTTLRMVGGLIDPDQGEILIFGRSVARLPAWERNCGFVFQSYALFPHMTVAENIAYGLRVRRWERNRIKAKVQEVAQIFGIEGMLNRRPKQLSGGQQQRVAVARALAIGPDVLLMDEPLANLDAQLRERIRFELRRIQQKTGVTVIYVTHDQAEAFAMSDRIVVMNAGRVEQVGTPQEIFGHPASPFVASFVGSGNLLEARVETVGEADSVQLRWGGVGLQARATAGLEPGQAAVALIRTQDFEAGEQASNNLLAGTVSSMAFLGTHYRMTLDTPDGPIQAELDRGTVEKRGIHEGSPLRLRAREVLAIPQEVERAS